MPPRFADAGELNVVGPQLESTNFSGRLMGSVLGLKAGGLFLLGFHALRLCSRLGLRFEKFELREGLLSLALGGRPLGEGLLQLFLKCRQLCRFAGGLSVFLEGGLVGSRSLFRDGRGDLARCADRVSAIPTRSPITRVTAAAAGKRDHAGRRSSCLRRPIVAAMVRATAAWTFAAGTFAGTVEAASPRSRSSTGWLGSMDWPASSGISGGSAGEERNRSAAVPSFISDDGSRGTAGFAAGAPAAVKSLRSSLISSAGSRGRETPPDIWPKSLLTSPSTSSTFSPPSMRGGRASALETGCAESAGWIGSSVPGIASAIPSAGGSPPFSVSSKLVAMLNARPLRRPPQWWISERTPGSIESNRHTGHAPFGGSPSAARDDELAKGPITVLRGLRGKAAVWREAIVPVVPVACGPRD